jgi:hypothetical protein
MRQLTETDVQRTVREVHGMMQKGIDTKELTRTVRRVEEGFLTLAIAVRPVVKAFQSIRFLAWDEWRSPRPRGHLSIRARRRARGRRRSQVCGECQQPQQRR